MRKNCVSLWIFTCNASRNNWVSKIVALAILKLIGLYQLLFSAWVGRQCRFYPTCSHYAAAAVQQHGPWKGMWLALLRLGRCHPFNPGGVDMVPVGNDHSCHSTGAPSLVKQDS
ncbi:MAG: membrane protein insertion efficiency factor YidD [Gammaproteobacteria bacterium]|nr:membrane protein insertion efficiency factor YidD [Gammaproteobacteria bacterium]